MQNDTEKKMELLKKKEELWTEYKETLKKTGESPDGWYPALSLVRIRNKFLFAVYTQNLDEIEETLDFLKSDDFVPVLWTNPLSDKLVYLSVFNAYAFEHGDVDYRIKKAEEDGCVAFVANADDKALLMLAYEEAKNNIKQA